MLAAPGAMDAVPVAAFQTWEYAPQYAIRSWAYIAMHALVPSLVMQAMRGEYAFYALRCVLAAASAAADTALYVAVARHINPRVARYMLAMLATLAGPATASVALLPSSFVMYTTSLAMAYAMAPASTKNWRRTFGATASFAVGALGGWPYALLLALPFVVEELLVHGADGVAPRRTAWFAHRLGRWLQAVAWSATLAAPLLAIDTLAYGHWTLVAWNTLVYNVLGRARGLSPDLYGVEPWTYYAGNLLVNFNVVTLLGLLALPAALLLARCAPSRYTGAFPGVRTPRKGGAPPQTGTHPCWLLLLRLLPAYLWLGVMTAQAHKEERFLYPVYPLLCFHAAVTLYAGRVWMEGVYQRITRSPYRTSQTWTFSLATGAVLTVAGVLGVLRSVAMVQHYHAPMDVLQTLPNEPATVCYGKEWHRFPSHFFVPPQVHVAFIPSGFHGILPDHFGLGKESSVWWPWARATRRIPTTVNEHNREERDRYVSLGQCDYLVDVTFPLRPPSALEPVYSRAAGWTQRDCRPFLDAEKSREIAKTLSLPHRIGATLARTVWLPRSLAAHLPGGDTLVYGDYCLLEKHARVPLD